MHPEIKKSLRATDRGSRTAGQTSVHAMAVFENVSEILTLVTSEGVIFNGFSSLARISLPRRACSYTCHKLLLFFILCTVRAGNTIIFTTAVTCFSLL